MTSICYPKVSKLFRSILCSKMENSHNSLSACNKNIAENFFKLRIKFLTENFFIKNNTKVTFELSWIQGKKHIIKCTVCNVNDEIAFINFCYKVSRVHYRYRVMLVYTLPHFGGKRWWFKCPVDGCDNKASVLYLDNVFACRKCHNIAYKSQIEQKHFRLLSKAQNIHKSIGGNGCVLDIPKKPKWMHSKTYKTKVDLMNSCFFSADKIAEERYGKL